MQHLNINRFIVWKVQYVSVLPSSYRRNGESQGCIDGDRKLKEFGADKTSALTSGSETLSRLTEMGVFKLIIFPKLVPGDNSCHLKT